MKKLSCVVLGYGDRGERYSDYARAKKDELEVIGVIDPNPVRRDLAKQKFSISDDMLFENLDEFLAKKVKLNEKLTALQNKYDAAHANSVKMKEMHDKITMQIDDLNSRKNTIKAKIATAKIQERINKVGSSVTSATGSLDAFSRMEEKANKINIKVW